MAYPLFERDRYVALNQNMGPAWDLMEPVIVPPSLEVFRHGFNKALEAYKRPIAWTEYAGWLVQWAQYCPDNFKEAP